LNNIHGEYGDSSYTANEEIREYQSEENPVNQEKSLVEDTTNSDY